MHPSPSRRVLGGRRKIVGTPSTISPTKTRKRSNTDPARDAIDDGDIFLLDDLSEGSRNSRDLSNFSNINGINNGSNSNIGNSNNNIPGGIAPAFNVNAVRPIGHMPEIEGTVDAHHTKYS